MPFRDLLKKKSKAGADGADGEEPSGDMAGGGDVPIEIPVTPEFKFVRTTTTTEETIAVPGQYYSGTGLPDQSAGQMENEKPHGSRSPFRRASHKTATAALDPMSSPPRNQARLDDIEKEKSLSPPKSGEHRLSRGLEKLHLRSKPHSRSTSAASSVHVPLDLPDISPGAGESADKETKEAVEAQWEKRATLLAQTAGADGTRAPSSELARPTSARSPSFPSLLPASPSSPTTPSSPDFNRPISPARYYQQQPLPKQAQQQHLPPQSSPRPLEALSPPATRGRALSNPVQSDVSIQEAIKLHETGALRQSTSMFATLADPNGENNALAQVLYGLALRHGWGTDPDQPKALTYLSLAASNAANIETTALSSGLNKGGAAKGELILAIYELGNSFRHGWGVDKDPVAARHYYETAANLGDTDAMQETAFCYLNGIGGKKDKFAAAKYLRMAEAKGVKSVGESWIWKEKYAPKDSAASAASASH